MTTRKSSTKYTLRFIGDRIRSHEEDNWTVEICNTIEGNTSYRYFATIQEVLERHPEVTEQYRDMLRSRPKTDITKDIERLWPQLEAGINYLKSR